MESSVVERPWVLHWYSRPGFQTLATAAGLTVTAVTDAHGTPARVGATNLRFRLQTTTSTLPITESTKLG